MSPGVLLVLSAFPSLETARTAARILLEKGFAACVQLLPGVESHYRWKGELETAQECLLLGKLLADQQAAVLTELTALHPYEVPEIVFVPTEKVAPAYLEWMQTVTQAPLK
jgi:periplasmic divalent cation tolerance protein